MTVKTKLKNNPKTKNKKKNIKRKISGLPELILPDFILDEMHDYMTAKIQSFPQYNILEKVSEWAEKNRSIGGGLTARPGPVDFSVTPYLREIADNLSDMSPIIEIYLIKGTQMGGTVMILENHIGYCIQYGIGPLLLVAGDQKMAEEQMEKRIDEMVSSSNLQGKIKANIQKSRGKSTGDKVDSKSYAGTFMRAVGPNSESKLRMFPMRILHLDEIDIYPQKLVRGDDDSADPIEKAERRADSYRNLKKIFGLSTPKKESTSRIAEKVEEGDKRFYNVKCPKCNKQQPLLWVNFKWDKNELGEPDIRRRKIGETEIVEKDPTYFVCMTEDCDHIFRHKDKRKFLQEIGHGGTAEWIPTKTSNRPFVRSYVLPAWYGFRTWMDIVLQFYRVKDDPFKFPTFVNDVMAETWKDSDQKPSEHVLLELSAQYEKWDRGYINEKVLMLTIAVDVHPDRLEVGLMGHCRRRQDYMIEHWVFQGDASVVDDNCWSQLEEKINNKYTRSDGRELFVMLAGIDSQHLGDVVDLFCEKFPYAEGTIHGVFPLQSRETQTTLVKEMKGDIKTPTIQLHDQEFKRVMYNVLKRRPAGVEQFPSYYLHFSHEYNLDFFKQLTSEEIVQVKSKNVIKGYLILNTKQRRNEIHDIVKYHLALFEYAQSKYFEIKNDALILQKRKKIEIDTNVFFDVIENMFYEEPSE